MHCDISKNNNHPILHNKCHGSSYHTRSGPNTNWYISQRARIYTMRISKTHNFKLSPCRKTLIALHRRKTSCLKKILIIIRSNFI